MNTQLIEPPLIEIEILTYECECGTQKEIEGDQVFICCGGVAYVVGRRLVDRCTACQLVEHLCRCVDELERLIEA